MLLAGAQSIFGFAYIGPFNEPYQVNTIGYNLGPIPSSLGDDGGNNDVGAPKNFNQGYRWNTPTNYYAYDSTFLSFFGSNGVAAVDQAFAVYNNLTNVSQLNLNDWPLQSGRYNFEAQALSLVDLKSYTMSLIIEQLGLAQPDRWTWCLHDRILPGGAVCPNYDYLVIQRNFSPTNYNYSPYVNGVLYDYVIVELCGVAANPYAPLVADAIEVPVDPSQLANTGSAVASGGQLVATFGNFYTSLSQDDIGGLKALYSATNVYVESVEPNSVQVLTNQQDVQILVTSNLSDFLAQALTNSGPALNALYPSLVIISNTVIGFTNLVTTNETAVLYYPPNSPAGFVVTKLVPVLTTNIVTLYSHTYANLEILSTNVQASLIYQTVSDVYNPDGPAGQFNVETNYSTTFYTTTDYYILPTNLCGPYQIVSTQLVQQVFVTNPIPINTTAITNTNAAGVFSANQITSFNQYSLVVYPVECGSNLVSLREGMEKINFIRQDFDSLLGQAWTPVTNFYHLIAITNGAPFVQTFRRILTKPDIILSAADLASGPAALIFDPDATRTTPTYNVSLVPVNQGGPGTIEPQGVNFVYNSVGTLYENDGPPTAYFQYPGVATPQGNSTFEFQWGSFDGSTNDPVVYPSSTSLAGLQAQVFFQITTGLLPPASVSTNKAGNPYSFTNSASGASPFPPPAAPYVWSLAQGSAGLPTGLSLSAAGVVSGSPTTPGTYDFTVQATDAGARTTQKSLFIVIDR